MEQLERIFPECFADTLLVKLIIGLEHPMHRNGIAVRYVVPNFNVDNNNVSIGKGTVMSGMKLYANKNDFIVGVIDTDNDVTVGAPRRNYPKYLREFKHVVEDKIIDEGLIVLQLPGTNHHIIKLHPEFEQWIWDAAQRANINPQNFGFSSVRDLELAKKQRIIGINKKLDGLVKAVIAADPPAIKTLRKWLNKALV